MAKKRNQALRSESDSYNRKKYGTDWTRELMRELGIEPKPKSKRKRRRGKRDNAKRLKSNHK